MEIIILVFQIILVLCFISLAISIFKVNFEQFVVSIIAILLCCLILSKIDPYVYESQRQPPIQVTEIPKDFKLIDTIVETDTGRVKVIFFYKMQKIK